MESAEAKGAQVDVPFAIVDLDQGDVLFAQVWQTLTHCLCQRIPPL